MRIFPRPRPFESKYLDPTVPVADWATGEREKKTEGSLVGVETFQDIDPDGRLVSSDFRN